MDLNYGLQRALAEMQLLRIGGGRLILCSPGAATDVWLPQLKQWFGAAQIGQGGIKVVETVADAISACEAGRGDQILVMPGTYTLTAAVVPKARTVIRGLPGYERVTIVRGVATAGVDAFTVSAADVHFRNLTIQAGSATSFCAAVSGVRSLFDTVEFGTNVADGDGLELLAAADDCRILGCTFDTLENAINIVTTAAGGPDDLLVKDCIFNACTQMITDEGSVTGVYKRLLIMDCVGNCDAVDGTLPSDYIKLNTVNNGEFGMITGCRFSHATNATLVFVIPAQVRWAPNATEAGWSTGRPS